MCNFEKYNSMTETLYSHVVLNSIKLSGIPNHELNLKVGALVMLSHNLDHSLGLYNGTHMHVINIGTHMIEAEIIYGNNIGAQTFI